VYKDWATGVSEACQFNLRQPLLVRNQDTKLIQVNFDPQLTAVLREVKYLEVGEKADIPESATSIFEKNDTLWQYVTNLDLTVFVVQVDRQT